MVGVFARVALRKGRQALLDLKLFRQRAFPISAQTQFLQNGIAYATQMLLPLYLIRSCGRTPAAVGVLLLLLGLGMMVVYPSLGWLTNRSGIRNVATSRSLVSLLTAIAPAFMARHNVVGPVFAVALLLRGIGQGAIGVPSISAAYHGVPKSELPMASTTLNIRSAARRPDHDDFSGDISSLENAVRTVARGNFQRFRAHVCFGQHLACIAAHLNNAFAEGASNSASPMSQMNTTNLHVRISPQ